MTNSTQHSERTYKGMTAAQYREAAKKSRQRVSESWDRSDTDGFMSQWAGDLTAQMYELQAKILDEGGTAEFPALFNLSGELVAAKLVSVYDSYKFRHVSKWAVLSSDDPDSEIVKWIKLSEAQDEERRIANNAKKGYYEGTVIAPAAADMAGANKTSVYITTKRIDGGFSRDVTIIDNGLGSGVRAIAARQSKIEQIKKDTDALRAQQRAVDENKRSQTSSNKINKKTRTKSATKREEQPAASSRAVSTSHANCTHESSKAARAKCRRERASK